MNTAVLAIFLAQVGPFSNSVPAPGVDEALLARQQRERPAEKAVQNEETRDRTQLAQCLVLAGSDPEAALDQAQTWRERVESESELAQSAHCLGLAMVRLERFDEARQSFEIASAEAPTENPAYRARLAAMAGNAALADGKVAVAEPLFAGAVALARTAADARLTASLLIDQARALGALERLDDAATALKEAREIDSSSAQAWLVSAALARRMERLGEAQGYIQQAAAIDPRSPAIGLEAGIIAALGGREADARKSFTSVVEVAPQSEEAVRARGYLQQLGN